MTAATDPALLAILSKMLDGKAQATAIDKVNQTLLDLQDYMRERDAKRDAEHAQEKKDEAACEDKPMDLAPMVDAIRSLPAPQVNVSPTMKTEAGAQWLVEGSTPSGATFRMTITKL